MGFKARRHRVSIVAGVEGPGVYLNNIRIAGYKPWGGGHLVGEWPLSEDDLQRAVKRGEIAPPADDDHAGNSAGNPQAPGAR